jgi:hypothetical protein
MSVHFGDLQNEQLLQRHLAPDRQHLAAQAAVAAAKKLPARPWESRRFT